MPESGGRGYAVWDRERGWSNGDDDDGKINRKKADISDLDVHVPVSEIDDDSEKPDIDIDDTDKPDLNIVPVTPGTGTNNNDEDVIRDSIIRDGILDESRQAVNTNTKPKKSEIN